MSKRVLDLSKWNTVTDYDKLASGIDGVLIRVGYRSYAAGNITEDASFKKHLAAFVARKVPVGLYFFTTAITEAEAIEEAQFVHKMIKQQNIKVSFPIIVDSEYSNANKNGRSDNLSITNRTKMLKAFCKEVVRLGYKACIYASDSWFRSKLDMSQLSEYSVWVARYGNSPVYTKNMIGWQYTSSFATTAVTAGRVDMSEWYGEIKEYDAVEEKVEAPADPQPAFTLKGGAKITLNRTAMYASSTTSKISSYKSGVYYVWSPKAVNGRIRITNKASNVGVVGAVSGWIKVSSIGLVLESTPAQITTGLKISLKKAPLYASSISNKVVAHKSGTYYVWSKSVVNGRIRITNSAANVGKTNKITGWISKDSIITYTVPMT